MLSTRATTAYDGCGKLQRLNSPRLRWHHLFYSWFPPCWPSASECHLRRRRHCHYRFTSQIPSTQRRTSSRGFDFPIGLDAASESGRRRHLRRSSDWCRCSLAASVLGRDCEKRILWPGADCLVFHVRCREFSVVTGPRVVSFQRKHIKSERK